jgi:hypothetical protein
MALVARSLMYSSVRQATSDLTSAVLGADAGSVVAEGLDTIVAAQARRSRLEPKMDPALHVCAHHGALSPRCGAHTGDALVCHVHRRRMAPAGEF